VSLPFFAPLGEGFLLGLGLIIGFGPQNSFILQQGLRREFIFTVALLASLIDLVLITLGAVGVGGLFVRQPAMVQIITWASALFLLGYGWRSFRCALNPLAQTRCRPRASSERSAVVMTVLAVSLLNPSAYLDTLLIIGGGVVRYEPSLKLCYASGAILASVVWFFTLAFSAARLGEVLSNKTVLRLIDALSGVMMWFIAARLLLHTF
jgi:L-lysine exporter family protein LysE/ArgO